MNRRNFLAAVGSSAALAGLATPRTASAQSSSSAFNSPPYTNCNSAHAIAAGQGVYGAPNGNIWAACSNPMEAAYTNFEANNYYYSNQIAIAAQQITPAMVTSANMNQAQILQAIQIYTPQFTAANVQSALAYIDAQTQDYIQTVITYLEQGSAGDFISGLAYESQQLATYLGTKSNAMANPLFTQPAPPNPCAGIDSCGGSNGGNPPSSGGNPPSGGGSGGGNTGWTCAKDAAYITMAGVVFATITVMSLGSAPVLVGAAWAGIGLWGGLASTAWGVGHAVAGC